MKDAYKSLIEALTSWRHRQQGEGQSRLDRVEVFEKEDPAPFLEHVHGILVPGGFGQRGAEGKIKAATFARQRKVPYFGICFGMQMAVIEAARSLAGIEKANSTEFGPTEEPVVGLMTEWLRGNELEKRAANGDLGGTMRLGAYPRDADPGSKIAEDLWRRPRSPSAIAIATRSIWAIASGSKSEGLKLLGPVARRRAAGDVEYPDHPWFIGVQYHPELKSRPFEPHPLFASSSRRGGAEPAGLIRDARGYSQNART
jgi:CTP synthase